MALRPQDISALKSDEQLFDALSSELQRRLPADEDMSTSDLVSAMSRLPRGLRAMAAIHALDVSMALDDLGCHFVNHPSRDLALETRRGLDELGATEAAQVFSEALEIVAPFLEAIWTVSDAQREELQKELDPLNDKMWAICEQSPDYGLLHYWLTYARKYPDRIAE